MTRIALVATAPALLLLACAHKPEAAARAKTPADVTAPAQATAAPASAARGAPCKVDLDCGDGQLCLDGRCVDITRDMSACGAATVHFPFNSALLEDPNRATLQRSARCLKAAHALHITIAGNADERGTDEYNLALGDERATAVKGYLEALGVSDAQLATVSYGKEQPLCTEHDEACWARNRRAELHLAASRR